MKTIVLINIIITGIVLLQCSEEKTVKEIEERVLKQYSTHDTITIAFRGSKELNYRITGRGKQNNLLFTDTIRAKETPRPMGTVGKWSNSYDVAGNSRNWTVSNGHPTITVRSGEGSTVIMGELPVTDLDITNFFFRFNCELLNPSESMDTQLGVYVTLYAFNGETMTKFFEARSEEIKCVSSMFDPSFIPRSIGLRIVVTRGVISLRILNVDYIRYTADNDLYTYQLVPLTYNIEGDACFEVQAYKVAGIYPKLNVGCISVLAD